MILGIVGFRLSGKNLAAEYLHDKYGFAILDYTQDVLAPLLRKEKKAITRENLSSIATELRKENGNDILTKILCEKILPEKDYVIAGIRFKEEVEYLRKVFGNKFKLVSVECHPKKRYARAKERRDKGEGNLSFQRFMRMENLPTERVIPETMKLAGFRLENNKEKEDLFAQIDKIMKRLK